MKRTTLADTVYDDLRRAILCGELPDGEDLNQVALARRFNVSRVPVREALRRLQSERLVTASPYQQYVVSTVTSETVLELLDIRELLEVQAIRAVAEHQPAGLAQQLRSHNAELRRLDDGEQWLAGDIELHRLMHSGSAEVARLVVELRGRVHRYMSTAAASRARRLQACTEHDRIIDAIEIGDPEMSEAAIREHIGHTRRVLASRLAGNGDVAE